MTAILNAITEAKLRPGEIYAPVSSPLQCLPTGPVPIHVLSAKAQRTCIRIATGLVRPETITTNLSVEEFLDRGETLLSVHTPHDLFALIILVHIEHNWGDVVVAVYRV